MNILFIEDQLDLQAVGVAQLEAKGHTVYATCDLAESRAILSEETIKIDLIISDHRLPDGFGIQFIIEIKRQYPRCKCAIVSGCITAEDIEALEEHKIRYFRKPLLYARVLEEMRNKPSASTPVRVVRSSVPPPEPPEEAPKKKKKLFGFSTARLIRKLRD